jgi:hypothetical protein
VQRNLSQLVQAARAVHSFQQTTQTAQTVLMASLVFSKTSGRALEAKGLEVLLRAEPQVQEARAL